MNVTEKRRSFLINVMYFAVLIGLFFLFFKYAFGICLPLLTALFVAAVLQKPVDYLTKKAKGGRGVFSALLVIFCFVVLGSIFAVALMKLFSEMKSFFGYLMLKLENTALLIEQVCTWIETKITILPDSLRTSLSAYAQDILTNIFGSGIPAPDAPSAAVEKTGSFDFSWLASPIGAVWGTAKQIPVVAVGIVVAIVSGCFMTADYASLKSLILKLAGEKNAAKIVRTKNILFSTLGKMGRAYCIIILVTFFEMVIGLSFLKLIGVYTGGYIFAISLITAIVDVLPVLGTGTILVPWSVWSLLTGDIGFGIGILVVYAIITVIRQIIEPKLVASQLGLPAYVTITAMYIGTRLFGFIGLFLLPISIMVLKVLNDDGIIHIFRKKPVTVEEVKAEVAAEEEEELKNS